MIVFLIIGNCLGCLGQESAENSSKTSNDSINASGSENVENLNIDYSDIKVLPPYNKSESEWLKTNASHVAQIALNDSRAKKMIREEGATIAGVVYSCHPVPENYTGSGCAPALRIESESRTVDFLVDEEKGIVVETVMEITSNSTAA